MTSWWYGRRDELANLATAAGVVTILGVILLLAVEASR
jgi:hypothetical protein